MRRNQIVHVIDAKNTSFATENNNDHENIGVLLTESALESEHKSSICMVSQEKRTKEKHLQS